MAFIHVELISAGVLLTFFSGRLGTETWQVNIPRLSFGSVAGSHGGAQH